MYYSFIFFLIFLFLFQKLYYYKNHMYKLNYYHIKISIIYPVFNAEKYINRSLTSIINQSFKNIKIICVDDGSTDNTGKILDYYAKFDSRIIVIHKKKNSLRCGSAKNEGLNHIEGEYVSFVDADDFISPLTFEYTYKYAKKDDIDLLEFKYSIFENKKNSKCNFNDLNLSDAPIENVKEVWSKLYNTNWNKLYKTTILIKSKISFTNDIIGQDVEFNYKLLPFLKKIKRLQGKYYCYLLQRKKSVYKNRYFKENEFYSHIIEFWRKNKFDKNKIWFLEILISVYDRFLWKYKYESEHINIFINILSKEKDIFNKIIVNKIKLYYINELKTLLKKYDDINKKNYYKKIFN